MQIEHLIKDSKDPFPKAKKYNNIWKVSKL